MNRTILFGFLMMILVNVANAAEIQRVCFSKAVMAVENFVEPNRYDEDGLEAYACEFAPNKKAILCEVGASKGDGAAMDTYRVVLNASCSKVFRVELIGEE